MYPTPGQLRTLDNDARDGLRDAARFALGVGVLGAGLLIAAMLWVSTCQGATADTVACGTPQRTLLALAAPAVLMLGGLRSWFRAFQTGRRGETARHWHGAGWLLMAAALLVLTTSMLPLTGSAVFG
ncbi:hypothetical protein SAMN04489835_5609 [Mycolicibacterium rutilum]|uniref:Transmembrane protein n=1 Tax=Mycolicibacterium rutilum TaxID=370526 RepID=A0A1H6LXR4_MYCRU|nr:hypothetical protein [Mycolicibacterium rutilum]SEH91322.1 hypothetical protein SAMN04489835_5609 [Mycolicibacterium rutilum]